MKTEYKNLLNTSVDYLVNGEYLLSSITKLEKSKILYNLEPKIFFPLVSCLTPQSYGAKIEKYIINKLNGKKVPSTLGRGDMLLNDKYIEVKSSILKGKNTNSLNFVQIRPFSDIDYYLGIAINPFDLNNSYVYTINHNDMLSEIKKFGQCCHGTKIYSKENKNIEYRFTLNLDKDLDYWEKYRNKDFEKILLE